MDTTDISLPQPIEYVDTICLDKSVILPDGCTTATLTTEDGEAVTLIVSQHLSNNNSDSNEPIKEIIEADDCDILSEAPTEELVKNSSVCLDEDSKSVYAIHFPENSKNESFECLDNSENGRFCDDKSENSIDHEIQMIDNSDVEDMPSTTNLEDFMDVVTTYKCKFCRFSCPWKSGLVSHIRCCHISEKKCIVTTVVRAEKEPNIVTAIKDEKTDQSQEKDGESVQLEIENAFSLNEAQDLEDFSQDSNKSLKSPKSETDSEQSIKESPILERHIFLCGQCSDGFMTLDDCKQHMIEAHNIKLDQNMIKPLKKRGRPRKHPFNDDGSVTDGKVKRLCRPPKNLEKDYDYGAKKPRKENLNERPHKCNHSGCAHRFSTEYNLHYHYSSHASPGKSFICPECQETFELWRGLVMHLWKEHTIDIDLYSCSECNYKTHSFFKLDNHKRIHSDERSFICQTCGKAFKQVSQLRNHLVIHLDRKNLPEKRWYSEQECDICGRKFSDTKCLRKHQQAVHSKLKPYICSYCGHLSARKAMLDLHMRQHTGEKPFQCEHCDYRTGDHNSLRRHRMRHTGAKPYKCPHCPYACIQAISYKTHLRNKHPGMDGLYSCTLCTFKSVSKENYINHMSDHKREAEQMADTNAIVESSSEILLESIQSDQSPVQMHLNDNALQQLEGILPGNITAAQLIYSCLNALSQEGGTVSLPPGVTVNIPQGTTSTTDGTQTITIQLPSSQEMENEPYYFAIQQDGNTAAVVLPSDDTNEAIHESTANLNNVHFEEQDVSGASLDCSVLQEDDGVQLHDDNTDSIVITHIESFDDSESFTTAIITDDDPNQES